MKEGNIGKQSALPEETEIIGKSFHKSFYRINRASSSFACRLTPLSARGLFHTQRGVGAGFVEHDLEQAGSNQQVDQREKSHHAPGEERLIHRRAAC